ncbi:MAG: HAD family hydrolase [Bacteroidetes Order II. Incertae sedis bacterium]|nr:HAD family hydrolase [Bacteroidetes Order II. bacterium]
MKTIAAFDFDGTITTSDSLYHFIRFTHTKRTVLKGFIRLLPVFVWFKLGLMDNQKAKEAVLHYFFAGMDTVKFQSMSRQFAQQYLPSIVRPKAIEKIRWHQKEGHRLVLVSASVEAYLTPWAAENGFQEVCGSKLEIIKERLTGRLAGKNCWGPEKVARLEDCVGALSSVCLYAYGDTRGDRELLAAATYPHFRAFE